MRRIVQQTAILPSSPERLFDMYLDSAAHAAFTGAPVTIGTQPGSPFRAFNETLSGTILQAIPKRLIVQSWRSANWKPDDIDSTLIMTFWPDDAGGRIELVHVNIPEHDLAGVAEGWKKYYWTPWRAFLGAGQAQSATGAADSSPKEGG